MNAKSIRFQLITWYAGLLLIVFAALGFAGYFGLRSYLRQSVEETLTKRAQQIVSTLSADAGKTDAFLIEDITTHYAPEINDRFLRITRGNGTVLYASGQPRDGSFDPSHLPISNPSIQKSYLREEMTSGKRGLLIYSLPFVEENGNSFLIEAGVSSNQVESPLRGLLITLILGLPIVLSVAIAGGYLLIGRALIPVDMITRTAEGITSRNLSERLPTAKTGDEIERLSIALNHMIARLEEAFQYTSRFTADASHELRTPLTILHCDLEAIIQTPRLAPDIREAIGSALSETERLAKIVESLLAISRLDAGEARIELSNLDLAELTFATVEQMRLLAEDKGITLHFFGDESVEVQGDPSRLKQVIVNLLDNAIKYTPPTGTIDVKATTEDGKAILEISDTGMGISAEALPHIFERFYRADKARTRLLGGAGLGLSIVKSICAAHGGQVTVTTLEGKGSRFCVELPLASRSTGGRSIGSVNGGVSDPAGSQGPSRINANAKLRLT
ncbi:MAG TPA: ATP-binding protein [Blastocatellia bacterium]|nr:ATP-binding protein [Blastocatellia bacterium]